MAQSKMKNKEKLTHIDKEVSGITKLKLTNTVDLFPSRKGSLKQNDVGDIEFIDDETGNWQLSYFGQLIYIKQK